jgi:hypothetical protein
MYEQRSRKTTARSRLAKLREKVESFPESTEEEKTKKESLHKELNFEYLDNILGEIEKVHVVLGKKTQEAKKRKSKK